MFLIKGNSKMNNFKCWSGRWNYLWTRRYETNHARHWPHAHSVVIVKYLQV